MKKNILSLAALLIASAAVFTACSSDDNVTSEQPANPTGKYIMTVQASKGDDATTRALTLGRNDDDTKNVLNATWDANEVVLVYQGGSQIGTLRSAASATNETTLTGTLDSAPDENQDLTLYFHTNATPSYAGQDGTLATIASKYDFCAPATITAGSFTVSGNTVSTTSSASFGANQQAIVKFTLIDKADGTTPLSTSQLVISVGTTDYTITPTSPTSEIYAAIPGFEGQTVKLTATVGDYTYIYEKASVSFTNGQYYEITVKMTKQAAEGHALSASAVGEIVGTDGKAYAVADKDNLPTGVTAVAMVAYKSGSNGLAIALADEGPMPWEFAKSTCESKTAIGGNSWKLPSQEEWRMMFYANNGHSGEGWRGLNTAIITAGGEEASLQDNYWLPEERKQTVLCMILHDYGGTGSTEWRYVLEPEARYVRACFAF